MDISTKFRKVQTWLDSLYAGKPVPSFERNECTIELLYQLMLKNIDRDHDTQLIIQDLRLKATEYTVESQRIGGILMKLNLNPGILSQSGVMSLRTLANVAWLLEIRDPSDTSYLLALKCLQDEGDRIHEEYLAEERLLAQLTHKTKDALIKHSALNKACRDLEDQSIQQEKKVDKHIKDTSFLRSKVQEYSKVLSKLESTVSRTGVDSSLFHENLVKKARDLQKLEEELGPLKKKLQDYHDLPPDINQAKVKLAEIRRKVSQMETELSQKIDVMKL
ncbi:HAUS augmin-like complex subunit 1 [Babylonia areolata]|uniref:HAUS augmin-like complex subunit 1 n=1 Tax=Babylonia areolata TaxID=304850 RepID=UPI003FD255D2